MVKKLQSEFLQIINENRGLKERTRNLEVLMSEKVEKDAFKQLQEFIRLLPTKEDVQSLHGYITDSISKFKQDNDEFKKQFADHLEIIRRYDEVMSGKANKQAVIDVETRLKDSF